ncbi:2-Cys peroxiredoxin [bacterium SCN 62-11]|nr:MAG: 2-Cys peroxiredoxin [bacterium SCN 62-11]
MERTGEAFEEGIQLTVVGAKLEVGQKAPNFTMETLPPGQGMPSEVSLQDTAGKVRLLNVINSIDTPVCQCETRRWEELLGDDVVVYTVSMDLPFALQRWLVEEKARHQALSGHKNEEFGRAYGVLLKEWRLLQRAVFVIDGEGVIRHAEYVADQMKEPDYQAAVAAVSQPLNTP